jgi:hypothetical protein
MEVKKSKTRKISISVDQYRQLQDFAEKHDLDVETLVNQLLEKEIVESRHKALFVPGLKWEIDKNDIMMARILPEDIPRLQKWQQEKDDIMIGVHGCEGEIILFRNIHQT